MANQAPTFFTGGGPVATAGLGSAESVTIQPDGKMLVAGTGGGGFALARYNDDGSLDTTTFGGGDGIVTTAFTGDPAGRSVALQSDGKILVAGEGDDAFALVRYNADGSLDTTTFGGGDGIVTTRFTTATGPIDAGGHSVAVQPDGNIVVVGYSQVGSTVTTISLARYKDDGSPDTTFDGDGQVREFEGFTSDIFVPAQSVLSDVTILSDGKILAAGTVTRLDAPFDDYFALVRYNPDGSRDLSFGGGDGIVIRSVGDDGAANAMAVQADGKIVVAGYGGGLSSSDFVLLRYDADGIVDTTFDGNGRVTTGFGSGNEQAHSVKIQPDGKILVAGESGGVFALARYNAADGSLDTTFDEDGKVTTTIGTSSGGHSVTVLSDGRILVAGSSSEGGFTLVRYNSDGSLDYTFGGTNTLNGAPTYIENGAPITIDSSVFIYDPELGELNAGNGDYGGASITLARQGGANAQDVFGAGGLLSFSGSDVVLSGANIGTLTQAGGTLTIVFAALVTQPELNAVLSSLTYANNSQDPSGATIVWTFSDGNISGQGSGGARTTTGTTSIAITAVNDAPTFEIGAVNTLDDVAEYTERGDPVILDDSVAVFDAELAGYNNGQGSYFGASVTLARQGGADPDDVFGASGLLQFSGTDVILFDIVDDTAVPTIIGTLTQADGTLTITFGLASQAQVNAALSALTYESMSHSPPAAATIEWTFSDGNIFAQGEGFAKTATGTTTVNITAINEVPVLDIGAGIVTDPPGHAHSVILQPDGKILMAGVDNNHSEFTVVRYLAGGSLDPTFGDNGKVTAPVTSLGGALGEGVTMRLLPDGKIVLVGTTANETDPSDFGTGNNHDFVVVRYNADGSPDTTFGGDGHVLTNFFATEDRAFGVAVQPDGMIVAVGTSAVAGDQFALARYNDDGSLDASFGDNGKVTVPGGFATSVVVQSDGKLLVAGTSDGNLALVRYHAVAQYNPDGSLAAAAGSIDTSFGTAGVVTTNVGTFDVAWSVTQQADGKILVTGEQGVSDFETNFIVARYNADPARSLPLRSEI